MLKFKVVVPKGTLNPNANNVIEIPKKFENSEVLVASPSGGKVKELPENLNQFHPLANSTFAGPTGYSFGSQNSSYGASQLLSGSSGGASCPCGPAGQSDSSGPFVARTPSPMKKTPRQVFGDSVPVCPASSNVSLGVAGLEDEILELDKLEYVERETVKDDVLNYLKARRKLIFGLVTMEMAKAKKVSKRWKRRLIK